MSRRQRRRLLRFLPIGHTIPPARPDYGTGCRLVPYLALIVVIRLFAKIV